jgi:hypothetical protein
VSLCDWSVRSRRRFVSFLAVFFNTEGFCRVFIPGLGGFCLIHISKTKISLGEFSGEFPSVSKTSVWVLRSPVSFPPFLSSSFFRFSVAFRESILVNLESLSLSFKSFFVGVSRFAENGLGPPPIEGFVSPDSVLHRLSVELYSVIYSSISTWEAIRGRMAANEAEWPLPLSEELPEGLSDESAGGMTREVSSEAIPSTSSSRQPPRIDRSWKALSFFSKIRRDDDIDRIRRRYQIPDDVVLRIPDPDEKACCPKYEGDVAFYEADLRAGLRFPIQPFVKELLDFLSLAPRQVNLNGWRTIISCMVMWRVNSNGEEDLTVDEFLFCYEPVQIALSRGFWTFKNRDANSRVVQGLPSSDRIWKDGYFFVCGDNWERLPQEDPRDFVGVRRSWGTPSSSGVCPSFSCFAHLLFYIVSV